MNFNNSNCLWILVILFLFCCNGNGIGNIFGCGNDCTWIIILVLIFCCCGNGFSLCDNKC